MSADIGPAVGVGDWCLSTHALGRYDGTDEMANRRVAFPLCPPPQTNFRSSMKSIHLIALVLISAPILNVHGNEAFIGPSGTSSSAVDARGVRYRSDNYPGRIPPWLADRVQVFAPDYPYADIRQHREGVGLFRLTLDLKTGVVTRVVTLKSTGFSTLDGCAITSLRRGRWKPGKWKEMDIPVGFQLSWGSLPPASHMSPLPRPK